MHNKNLVFEKFQQTLVANQEWKTLIAGSFFRITVAVFPISVTILKNGVQVGKMQNMLAGDKIDGFDFDGVIINNGNTAQDVAIQIASGGAGSDRTLGEVSIIDGGKFRTLNDQAFIGYGFTAALAATYAAVQLYNPAGSTKNLYVEALAMAASTASNAAIRSYATQLATPGNFGVSKKLSGVASQGQVRNEQLAATVGTVLCNFGLAANTPFIINFREPVLIKPGNGLLLFNGVVGTGDLQTTFEYFEESI